MRPDHCTIARFRQENGKELERLFTQVLKLCAKAGLVKVGVVALDGTKLRANAALESNRTWGWRALCQERARRARCCT